LAHRTPHAMLKPRVFLSSTSDLAADRQLVYKHLGRYTDLYEYEYDRPRRESPADRCRNQIQSAQLFLCLVNGEYGSPFPDDSQQRSIVEWEFETAKQYKPVEIMTFVREVAPHRIDSRQRLFLERIQHFLRGSWTSHYKSSDEFRDLLLPAYFKWFSEFDDRSTQEVRRRNRWAPSVVMTIAVLAALMVPTVWLTTNLPALILLLTIAPLVVIILMCFVLSHLLF
jgi:hypothetical protein